MLDLSSVSGILIMSMAALVYSQRVVLDRSAAIGPEREVEYIHALFDNHKGYCSVQDGH